MITLTILVLILIAAILLIFPKARVLFKGIGNLMIEDMAATPKGAEAVFNEMISEKRGEYTKAKDILENLSGALETAKSNRESTQKKLANAEHQCEVLMSKGNEEDAMIMAQDVTTLKKKIVIYDRQIAELEPRVEDAGMIYRTLKQQINQLESEKDVKIEDLKLNLATKNLFNDLDKFRNSSSVSEMMKSVDKSMNKAREQAVGAKTVYDNDLDTKKERIMNKVQDADTDNYMAQLREKYKK